MSRQTNHTQNTSGFTELYNEHRDRLFHSMTGLVKDEQKAEDITATAFVIALKHLDSFRGESSIGTWLYAIALNEARSIWRRKEAVSFDALETTPECLIAEDTNQETLERSETCRRLYAVLRQIPGMYRCVLADHFLHGKSIKAIAKRRHIPYGTVLSRIFKAKQLLRRAWKEVT